MSGRLSREEKGKSLCFEDHEAPRTARIKANLPVTTELNNKFPLTIIGRITNPSIQRIWPLIAFFTELWKSEVRPVGVDLGNGLFQFQFEREADLMQVLEKRPYHYYGDSTKMGTYGFRIFSFSHTVLDQNTRCSYTPLVRRNSSHLGRGHQNL